MIALGWTDAGAKPLPGFTSVKVDQCTLLASPFSAPRQRLKLQIAAARRLEAFLPSSSVDIEDVSEWTRKSGDQISLKLEALRHRIQVSCRFTPPVSATKEPSRLRRKAAEMRLLNQAETLIASWPMMSSARVAKSRGGIDAALLWHVSDLENALPVLEAELEAGGAKDLPGWACTVVHPLPAFAFSDLAAVP